MDVPLALAVAVAPIAGGARERREGVDAGVRT
jgi:hypothetical protein